MKRAKEIQTPVSKKIFCKDYICNDILAVVKEDWALTTDQFAGWDSANEIFWEDCKKLNLFTRILIHLLHYHLETRDPFPKPLIAIVQVPHYQGGFWFIIHLY